MYSFGAIYDFRSIDGRESGIADVRFIDGCLSKLSNDLLSLFSLIYALRTEFVSGTISRFEGGSTTTAMDWLRGSLLTASSFLLNNDAFLGRMRY